MHSLPRRVLRQLVEDHGAALLDEPSRVDAFLADLCGPYFCERFILIHALQVSNSIANWSVAHWLGSCSQRLQQRYCFSAEAAAWAVESWSFALDVAPTVASTNLNGKEVSYAGPARLSDIPQRTLGQLLTDWGPDLLDEPWRVDALLADLCGPFARERFLLFHALRERIPTRLIVAQALREHIPAQSVLVHAPRERALAAHLIHPHGYVIHANWLSQHFQNRYGFSAEAAQWAVESCSFVVNIALPVQNLATANKPLTFVDEIMLRIRGNDPRSKAWVSAEVLARQKAKEHDDAIATARLKAEERVAAEQAVRQKAKGQKDAIAAARMKAEERESAEQAVRQKAKEQNAAVAAARQKEKERVAAEEAVRLKAKEQNEAIAAARQKNEERKLAKEVVRQKAEKRKAEKVKSLERAKETIAAQEATLTKSKEWVATKAADHQKANEWGAAEEEVLQKADEWVETKAADHQKIAGLSAAKAVENEKATEWVAAEKAALQRTEEWVATKAADFQKTVEWDEAEAAVLQKIREWVAAKTAARQKMIEWAGAEKAARVKAEERSAAERAARVKAEEQSLVEKNARVKAEEQSAAERAARQMALEEITLQILKETPLTSREVAAFLDREHEQAISWLRRLQATGKVESTWLKRSPEHPCYQTKDQWSAFAVEGEVL